MPLNPVLYRPMSFPLGRIIAERRLRDAEDPSRVVRLLIGEPREVPDTPNRDYYCPLQVVGVGPEKVLCVAGVDALQALELAVLILPSVLENLRKDYPGLGWVDAPPGDYGLNATVMSHPRNGEIGRANS